MLGLPLSSLPAVTNLSDLWNPAAARCLEAALAAAPTATARRVALCSATAARLAEAAERDPEVLGAVHLLGQPSASIADTALRLA